MIYEIQQYTQEIAGDNHRLFFCVKDGQVIGHASAHLRKNANALWLNIIFVKESERGMGRPASMLARAVMDYAGTMGYETIKGNVDTENDYALALYEKIGGTRTHENEDNIGMIIPVDRLEVAL